MRLTRAVRAQPPAQPSVYAAVRRGRSISLAPCARALKATGHHGLKRTGLTSRESDVREVERDVLRFVRDDACNAMQLQLVSLIDDGARDQEEEAQGGEEADDAATPHPTGRDRTRRLAESLLVLAELRWIGSQKSCPELKKLWRRRAARAPRCALRA